MKAVILSAGQGKRLLPYTNDRPKCLVEIEDKTILEWQIDTLMLAGIRNFVVITGFQSRKVEALIENKYKNINIESVYNPFYPVSDNLASCWIAREKFSHDFLIINGDDIFEAALIKKVLSSPPKTITVAVNIKNVYDREDMKVIFDQQNMRLQRVGKDIDCSQANGEAIGIHLFRGEGVSLFKYKVEELMRDEKGLKMWYLSAINSLVDATEIQICNISEYKWSEIDFIEDLTKAKDMIARNSKKNAL
jgi:choline kinase